MSLCFPIYLPVADGSRFSHYPGVFSGLDGTLMYFFNPLISGIGLDLKGLTFKDMVCGPSNKFYNPTRESRFMEKVFEGTAGSGTFQIKLPSLHAY